MNDLNEWRVTGRLVKGAETMTLPNGTPFVKLAIAVNKAYKDKNNPDGDWIKKTSFFDVAYYGQAAKNAADKFTKGRQVLVSAELKQKIWEKDGVKHYDIEIVADRVWPLSLPNANGNGSAGQSSAPPDYPPDWDDPAPATS